MDSHNKNIQQLLRQKHVMIKTLSENSLLILMSSRDLNLFNFGLLSIESLNTGELFLHDRDYDNVETSFKTL